MNKNILIALFILILVGGGIVFAKSPKNSTSTTASPTEASQANSQPQGTDSANSMDAPPQNFLFSGEKGDSVLLADNQVKIDAAGFETNKVRFFNTTLSNGKTVYYLVLKDSSGNFRVAANANEKCASFGKGYKQEGDQLICLTCQKSYPIEDFAVAQPDCNPKPITAKAALSNNQVLINSSELEKVAYLF